MKDVRLAIYAKSITVGEHQQLRAAVTAAETSGETTYLQDAAGNRTAAVVPLDVAERGARRPPEQCDHERGWWPCGADPDRCTEDVEPGPSLRERLADRSLSLCPDGPRCPLYQGQAPRHAIRAHDARSVARGEARP